MSDFTHLNFMDADDVAGARGATGLDARMVRDRMASEELGLGLFRYAAGQRSQFGHHHEVQEEAYVVVEGSGRVKLDEEIVELKQWDVLRVAPKVVRAFEAGADGLTLVCVGGTRPPEGDGRIVPGWWS